MQEDDALENLKDMKKLMVCLIFMRVAYQPVIAQHYNYNDQLHYSEVMLEGGISTGIINALTDLGGKKGKGDKFIKDLTWKTSRPAYGLSFTATYRNSIAVRLDGLTGSITAADSSLKKIAASSSGRYWRNLSFQSKLTEFLFALEIHPLCFRYDYYDESPAWSPYIVAGIGYFIFNPRAMLDGQWYELQPLRTEGQGLPGNEKKLPYRLQQFNFAAGLGLKYEFTHRFNLRAEMVHRFLKTDYLDDVSSNYPDPDLLAAYLPLSRAVIAKRLSNRSREIDENAQIGKGDQRGNPQNNDSYFTILLKLGIRLSRFGK